MFGIIYLVSFMLLGGIIHDTNAFMFILSRLHHLLFSRVWGYLSEEATLMNDFPSWPPLPCCYILHSGAAELRCSHFQSPCSLGWLLTPIILITGKAW